jgi:hypothetical protein
MIIIGHLTCTSFKHRPLLNYCVLLIPMHIKINVRKEVVAMGAGRQVFEL